MNEGFSQGAPKGTLPKGPTRCQNYQRGGPSPCLISLMSCIQPAVPLLWDFRLCRHILLICTLCIAYLHSLRLEPRQVFAGLQNAKMQKCKKKKIPPLVPIQINVSSMIYKPPSPPCHSQFSQFPLPSHTMNVLPPANGKKLWRIKRLVSSGLPTLADALSSLECFNSSQKISAAGKQFMLRRPPLKRPKLKPGMPKDFVFVDLSPVKLEESGEEAVSSSNSSVCSSPTVDTVFSGHLPSSSYSNTLNYSYNYASDDLYGPCFDELLLGLGLMGVEFPESMQPVEPQLPVNMGMQNGCFETPQFPQLAQFEAPQPVQQLASPETPQHSQKRRKSAGGFTFKSYTGPGNGIKKKKTNNHRRCFSEPAKKQQVQKVQPPTPPTTLEDFLHMPKVEQGQGFDLQMVDEMAPFSYSPESEGELGFDFLSFVQI